MSVFRKHELVYMAGGRQLGRIATVGADGTPHVVPVAFIYNAVRDTVDVGGYELERTKKFRDVARTGRAAIVIDDLASTDPWHPRGIEIRGRGEAIALPTPLIRIHPERIVSWGLERARSARTVAAVCAALAVALTASPRVTAATAATVPVPRAARAVETSHPDRWVGTGTARSCTSRAVVRAVAKGGVIRFRCGPRPVRIAMRQTAKVVNTSRRVVLDGRGLVTLSGGGKRRILYQNTCDQRQTWTTSHCDDQATPRLVVQNLTFADGDATGETDDGGGGGAIFARGGRLKVVGSRFARNRCDPTGPDLGGGAVRALSQYHAQPVYVVGSTFTGGVCSNGAALSSIGVSWSIYNSVFSGNRAIGRGANPARPDTAGGGSGGALYADGNDFRVLLAGTRMTRNHAREGGGAVFFVSNDRSGVLEIRSSTLRRNPSDGFETDPGIFFLGRDQDVVGSVVK
jgi:PPOX class F420-dependent enzyme/OxyR family protein